MRRKTTARTSGGHRARHSSKHGPYAAVGPDGTVYQGGQLDPGPTNKFGHPSTTGTAPATKKPHGPLAGGGFFQPSEPVTAHTATTRTRKTKSSTSSRKSRSSGTRSHTGSHRSHTPKQITTLDELDVPGKTSTWEHQHHVQHRLQPVAAHRSSKA
jgi:hypothetical protein